MTAGDPTRVLYIGLDACDAATMEGLATAGRCPTFAALLRDAAVVPTVAPYGTFVGSSWMTITTGRTVDHHRFWNWLELDPQTYLQHETSPRNAIGEPFWERVADSGRRVAVLDVPHMDLPTASDGVYLKEWGCHDRHDGTASRPPELLEELDRIVGRHPVGCIDHPDGSEQFAPCDYSLRAATYRNLDEDRRLVDRLVAGVGAKHGATAHVLEQGPWDLLVSVFGESHCVGHQFWHLHDDDHPRHDPAARRVIGDPVADVYHHLDGVLGDLLRRAGDDTTVYVQLNHGMGPHFDGHHLLDELLLRIDRGLDGSFDPGRRARLAARLLDASPQRLRPRLLRAASRAVQIASRSGPPAPSTPTGPGADRRWFQLEGNTSVGAIRLNVVGREAHGMVHHGAEYDRACDEIERALLDVVDLDTGRPLVRRVMRSEQVLPRSADDRLPDLFVEWNRDELIERVWSPKTGTVVATYSHWRTGDHHDGGLFLARGPGIAPGVRATPMALEDVAPTVAAALGVELGDIDGIVHPDLVPFAAASATEATRPDPPRLRLSTPGSRRPRDTSGDAAVMAAVTLDHLTLVERRSAEASIDLERRIDAIDTHFRDRIAALERRADIADRERLVLTTMAALAHEPVDDTTLVSVVTPTYARPERLANAIESVLAQRHRTWEMVIVDDGSNTARAVVERFDDPRLRLVEADHGGASAARNLALDNVRGDIVTYLDDDNLLDPGWLHAVAWCLRERPASSVLYGARIIDDSIRVYGIGEGGMPWMQFEPFDRHTLEHGNFADMGVLAHRSSCTARFDPTLAEGGDWDFFLALTEDEVPVELPAIALYYRTVGNDRLSNQTPADLERIPRKWAERRAARETVDDAR